MSLYQISYEKVGTLFSNIQYCIAEFKYEMDDENVLNNCCENQTIIHLNALIQKSCEEIFDGILLWPETFAGDTTLLPCPGPHSKVRKFC